MSAYNNLYNSVSNALAKSNILNHIEDFDNQYDNLEDFNNILYPAVYIEASNVDWNKDENTYTETEKEPQTGLAQIILHVCYHTLASFTIEERNNFNVIVDHVVNLVHRIESGNVSTGTFGKLLRIKEEYITPSKQIRVCILTFETLLKDTFEIKTDFVEEVVTMVLNTSIV